MTGRGEIPDVPPNERCRCVVPVEARGLNLTIGFGETRCRQCGKHVRFGVAGHGLTEPKA